MDFTNTALLPASRHYHRRPIRCLNRAWRTLNAVGFARIDFEEESMRRDAKQATGLEDFGEQTYLQPMRLLLTALDEEADLNPIGRYINRANILRLLKHQLYLVDLLKRHPEILEREFPDPVVIVGLARSGTTRLHRLLAADDQFLHLKAWESVNPVPYPTSFISRENQQIDPRITAVDQGLKAVLYMAPQMASVHPLGTFEVEEEIGLIQHGFGSQLFEIQAKIPSFAEWLMSHDQTAAYKHMLTLLKVIAWYRDDPTDKPWVLKSPQHVQDIDALLQVFPGAKLIFPHRDPIKVVGSTCSMAWNAILRDSDNLTADWIGTEWLGKTERMLHKLIHNRETIVPTQQQYDVQYADIGADWEKSIGGIYQFLQLPLTDHAVTGMQTWVKGNTQHKHGAHKYTLENFGLNPADVDARLAFYRTRYSIPYEISNPHL